MTFESEMMCWLMLIIFVWAMACCICEELENRNLLDDYYDSFEYKRTLAAAESDESDDE